MEAGGAGASVNDFADDAGRAGRTRVEGGDDSAEEGWLNRWAKLFTVGRLTGSWVARAAAIEDDAGPDTDRTEGFGVERTDPLAVCCR